ncbi:MAG: 30S ribosomal protein S4e [Thermoplasmata archaeon]|nr:30S ribosomal protein S4e [Thermoplasmata archaeon]
MSKHMKRFMAPRSWIIERKRATWAIRPAPGPHPVERSIPLGLLIRDLLGYAATAREAKRIIGAAEVLVDGKPTRDYKRPLGVMDVVSIPKTGEHFRILPDARGKLRPVRIDGEKAKWKLVRIENKTTVRGGRVQLNLHDGRNILLDKDAYRTGDVLKIALPSQEILAHYPLTGGSIAMIIGGRHRGKVSVIERFSRDTGEKDPPVVFKEKFRTVRRNVFVIGKAKPEISLPEVSVT